ncbi:hypothetical protein I79_018530 [Cricetulus griseus]|uniref:Uncharacterized protein n=1 Tax=Cricetulus griseus TaxID=10029 RepID=G3I4Y9_CRIGR|nr:hypothetical protein I79_018530 [Cricetulus griseus]
MAHTEESKKSSTCKPVCVLCVMSVPETGQCFSLYPNPMFCFSCSISFQVNSLMYLQECITTQHLTLLEKVCSLKIGEINVKVSRAAHEKFAYMGILAFSSGLCLIRLS